MKRLLSRDCVDVLTRLSEARVLLAFDFDGTLSPIVADRDAARMRARTRTLFARVCALYPCAVISGRSRADVGARLGGAEPDAVVGNHGMEPSAKMKSFAARVARLKQALARALADEDGVDIEDKRFSLAIHYRRARNKPGARAQIAKAIAQHGRGMRVVPGKLVVNVVPADAPHKGDALRALRKSLRADTALYVGDDITDEDVFALHEPDRLLSVRVGRSTKSAARYYLRDQQEMDALLDALVRLRQQQPKVAGVKRVARRA